MLVTLLYQSIQTLIFSSGQEAQYKSFVQFESAYVDAEETALDSVDAASRRTFVKFFKALPTFLPLGSSPAYIYAGFAATGMMPYCPTTILSKWPPFRRISSTQDSALLAGVARIAKSTQEQGLGYVLNSTIHRELHGCLSDSLAKLDPSDAQYAEMGSNSDQHLLHR